MALLPAIAGAACAADTPAPLPTAPPAAAPAPLPPALSPASLLGPPASGHEGLLSLRDVSRLVFSTGLVAIVSRNDPGVTEEVREEHGTFAHDRARLGEHLGNPVYSAPVLGALWAYGKLSDHPGLSGSCLRIAGGVAASVAAAGAVKYAVGRWRPSESPNDPYRYSPFSHHVSFPSGHTTVAFSLAEGVSREAHAKWVPWVAYPLAGLTGWSRVYEHDHWASDATAGAVIGLWATYKFGLVAAPKRAPVAGDDGPLRPEFHLGVAPMPDSKAIGPTLTVGF